MSSANLYKWRTNYGGMDTSMMSRMKELEDESCRIKKMYVDVRMRVRAFEDENQFV
jgi:putative transposase